MRPPVGYRLDESQQQEHYRAADGARSAHPDGSRAADAHPHQHRHLLGREALLDEAALRTARCVVEQEIYCARQLPLHHSTHRHTSVNAHRARAVQRQ